MGKYLEDKYSARIIYGDSVTGDTPVLLRIDGYWIYYRQISDVVSFKNATPRSDGKERIILKNIEVWSDQGWTPIKQIIRHKTQKRIYRIITKGGSIDVTEDHSLLTEKGCKIKPSELKIGSNLMHNDFPISDMKISWLTEELARQWGCDFANNNGVIPDSIISSTKEIHKAFLDGYLSIPNSNELTKLNRACLAYLSNDPIGNNVMEIIDLGISNDYVYDFETKNHHFAAGIGKLVVHNTDSSMIDLNIKDPKECDRMGKQLSEEISGTKDKPGLFPPPLKMEFEKAMRILCFDKKMYAAVLIDKNGNYKFTIKDMLKKGITSARRDSCKWIYKLHDNILINIMQYKDIELNMNLLVDAVEDLLADRVPYEDLLLVRGLGAS